MDVLKTLALGAAAPMLLGAGPALESYTEADFARVPKLDAHVHANVENPAFLELARANGFEMLSINVDYPDFPPLAAQAAVAYKLREADPERFHFATTFSMDGFGEPGWAAQAKRQVDAGFAHGAVAVKVWKNIGMVAKDMTGKRVFIDDPRFEPIMVHFQAKGVPLIAHQGEPKNCWLPLDQMTTDNDRTYFSEHPEYYMYRHPEEPSYEQLMAVRDRFVADHPHLAFDGAHLASLEWSVDELARFLDRYPNAVVDLAARMSQVQVQSNADRAKVRNFFIQYQDRVMYGTDLTDNPPDPRASAQIAPAPDDVIKEADDFIKEAGDTWRSDWRYLATPLSQHIDAIKAEAPGLALPRAVIDKIYYTNARRFFRLGREDVSSGG